MSAAMLGAQQVATSVPTLAGIAHAAIRVGDLARSRDFYEKLGFEEAFALDNGGKPTEAFLKINDRQFLELYPQRDASQAIGFMHVCFESADLEELNQAYVARGLAPTAVRKAGAGNLLFTMQGPEKQNIEYTQYMPGSKHTKDVGMHLGANRISTQIIGLAIEMQDPSAAATFYEQKLGFQPASHPPKRGLPALDLPGQSGAQIEFLPPSSGSSFRLLFSVPDLRRTAGQLKALQLPYLKDKSGLSIRDPDGNTIVFVKVKS
jgi:catechol 2,3-dioxygenase-like lactoylglutathione lyase family enzyme